MVLEFKLSNFRSIKQEQVFSFVAETTKSKPNNVFEASLPKGDSVRLLKSAVIYGANASGKSNFLKAFYAFRYFVTSSDSFKIDKSIQCYEPFLLDKESSTKPTVFEITFVGRNNIKYRYKVAYNSAEVLEEKLDNYPLGQVANLYERVVISGDYHEMKPGKELIRTNLPKKILKNQLILSRFGSEAHEQLNDVYRFFDGISVGNALDRRSITVLVEELGQEIAKPENAKLAERLNRLIAAADTSIKNVHVGEIPKEDFDFLNKLPVPEQFREQFIDNNKTRVFGSHPVFQGGIEVDRIDFDFRKNVSVGTNAMFALGGMMLKKFENGGLLVFDELDNSLHPKITRFFIQLFHNPEVNKANAQIVFSTHEPLLMDKDMFRSDQIWFTQKNEFGETELYSAQDFEGVREDIPFDKWYMAGRFAALPNIHELEFSL